MGRVIPCSLISWCSIFFLLFEIKILVEIHWEEVWTTLSFATKAYNLIILLGRKTCIVSLSGRTAVFNQEQLLLPHPSLISSSKTFRQDQDFHCRNWTAIMIQLEDDIPQGTPDLQICLWRYIYHVLQTRTRVIKTSYSGEWAPRHDCVGNKWFLQHQSNHRMPLANEHYPG